MLASDNINNKNEENLDEEELHFDSFKLNTWNIEKKRNSILKKLNDRFSSIICSSPTQNAIPDIRGNYRPEDLEYQKLPSAFESVNWITSYLFKNENLETRDFTLYIYKFKFVKQKLTPLLEICEKDDSLLTISCCLLVNYLTKKVDNKAMKLLKNVKSRKKDVNNLDLNEDNLEEENGPVFDPKTTVENAKLQVKALLSFKNDLCSGKSSRAVVNTFVEYMKLAKYDKENRNVDKSEDNKDNVGICFSYFRKLLSIEPISNVSSSYEFIRYRSNQDKFIIDFQKILEYIPTICSDLKDSYYDEWLNDIILIVYYSLKNFETKDLFNIWKTRSSSSQNDHDANSLSRTNGVEGRPSHVNHIVRNATQGQLRNKLLQERQNRHIVSVNNNSSLVSNKTRFRGTYYRPLDVAPNSHQSLCSISTEEAIEPIGEEVDPENSQSQVATQMSKAIYRDILSPIETSIANPKRNKKKATFKEDVNVANDTGLTLMENEEHYRAMDIAATLIDNMTNPIVLKAFVIRVNEDQRREGDLVKGQTELNYYDLVAKILNFNRLKVEFEYRKYLDRIAKRSSQDPFDNDSNRSFPRWEPDLRNVLSAMDKMSFFRVIAGIDRLMNKPEEIDELVKPMRLLKEMICYLNVLLESHIPEHHQIAIASLYRLYYASSGRLDPLNKLISSWKPAVFTREHLNTLVELIHETLKTLETAKAHFANEQKEYNENKEKLKKKYKKITGKSDMDWEQYQFACIRFDSDEYFKRIVSNSSVFMYIKLLSNYKTNGPVINHYIYKFFHRMLNFRLEQNFPAPFGKLELDALDDHEAPLDETSGDDAYKVNLGFMLFNIHVFVVFEQILNDPESYKSKAMTPLLKLIKSVVRRFWMACSKNHLLFVEMLFNHPRPHEFCCSIDNIYDAPAFAALPGIPEANKEHIGEYSDVDEEEKSLVIDNDYGDEYHDDDDLIDALRPSKEDLEKSKSKQQKKKKKRSKKRVDVDSDEELVDDASSLEGDTSPGSGSEKESHSPKKKQKVQVRSNPLRKNRNAPWTETEDSILKRLYKLYAGTHSVFTAIASHPDLIAFGSNRNESQVSKRVEELKLFMEINFSDEEDSNDPTIEKSTEPQVGSLQVPDLDDTQNTHLQLDQGNNAEFSLEQNTELFPASPGNSKPALDDLWGDDSGEDIFEKRSARLLENSSALQSIVGQNDNEDDDTQAQSQSHFKSTHRRITAVGRRLKKKASTMKDTPSSDEEL